MKKCRRCCFALLLVLALLVQPVNADDMDVFTAPLGCDWGHLNLEPDEATAIAKTSDGYAVSGYVPFMDPDMYQDGDEKGGYGVFFKLDNSGGRMFYRSYASETTYYCDPGICVTCGSVDVTDFVSHVKLGPSLQAGCTGLNDVAVIPAAGNSEEYVFTGTKSREFSYPDPNNPFDTDYSYVEGVWLLKTNSIGDTLMDIDYADRFPQEFDPYLYVYYSYGRAITPVFDPSTGVYDFLLAGNNLFGGSWIYGSLFRTNNLGGVEWEDLDYVKWNSAWYHGAGMTEIFETDDGYMVSNDGGIWNLNQDREEQWRYTGGYFNYRSIIPEGSDTVMVTTLRLGTDNFPALVKIDADKNLRWAKTYGCTDEQCELVKVVRTDYGYVMVGSTHLKGYGGLDAWLVGTDLEGNQLWDKTLGGEGNDKGMDLVFIPGAEGIDPSLTMAATASFDTNEDGEREPHAWIVKSEKDRYYPPVADFSYAPVPAIVEQAIIFTATASDTDGTPDRYDWDFGDGTVVLDREAIYPHTYQKPGTYEVTLSVWDNDGIQTIVKHPINVQFMTIQWERVFNNSRYNDENIEDTEENLKNDDMAGLDMVETLDGGFAITGYSSLWDNVYGWDPILMKVDDRGMFLWQQNFEGFGYDPSTTTYCAGEAIATDHNGDLVITGYVNRTWLSYTAGDLWVVKTDPHGTCQWQETVDNGFRDIGFDVAVMDDGYFIAGTRYTSTSSSDTEGWLAKVDFDGNYLSEDSVFFSSPLSFDAITRVDEGNGLLLTGGQLEGDDPVALVHTDNAGTVNWSTSYSGDSLFRYFGHWVDQADDGNYLVAGSQLDQLFIAKEDPTGDTGWETIVPDDNNNGVYGAEEKIWTGVNTVDDGYLMCATIRDDYHRYYDWSLVKFSGAGQYLWQWTQNDGADPYIHEVPRAIVRHDDGSYTILLNRGTEYTSVSSEFVLMKIGPSQDPIAAFEADINDDLTGPAPLTIHFKDRSTNGVPPYTYAWDFGDGSSSTEQNPEKSFAPGTHTVSLTITDDEGQTDTYTRMDYVTGRVPLPGDVDGDCDVDGTDLAVVAAAFNSEPGDSNWNPLADIDGNGQVNNLDLEQASGNLGTVCE